MAYQISDLYDDSDSSVSDLPTTTTHATTMSATTRHAGTRHATTEPATGTPNANNTTTEFTAKQAKKPKLTKSGRKRARRDAVDSLVMKDKLPFGPLTIPPESTHKKIKVTHPGPTPAPEVPYIETLYDQTFRAAAEANPSMSSRPHPPSFLAFLEHHDQDTDGSLAVHVGIGRGNFVSRRLLDLIPAYGKQQLVTDIPNHLVQTDQGWKVALGATIISFIVRDEATGNNIRLKLQVFVMDDFTSTGMFLSQKTWANRIESGDGNPNGDWLLEFGFGKIATVTWDDEFVFQEGLSLLTEVAKVK